MATLHITPDRQPVDPNKIMYTDQVIRSYIERCGNISYDPVISGETDWQIFYNLSELRTGIISWYDFLPGAEVLEIGAGFGALTGRLCSMCGHVTATERSLYRAEAIAKRYEDLENLDVYAGDISELDFEKPFDDILLIGLLERAGKGSSAPEPYIDYLKKLQKWLKPEGKILIAAENRYGLRYFCGAPEPHTNHAFDGINRYMRGTSGYSFSRQELEEICSKAGFTRQKFYYPLPDYKLPQLIYTDDHLPERNLKERLIPYYLRGDTLVAPELELYDDIVSNGVFPFFANSFLVECGMQGEEGQVVYAAVSTDRGEERSYATAICKGSVVRKTPLYRSGRENAERLYENITDLQRHGIPVVPHRKMPDGGLELPYISWPTLSDHIKMIMETQPEAVLDIVDRLYAYILQSSEQAQPGQNRLQKETSADFGPILKKAYIELIPLNCFYHPDTGDFLYFDQEFVREDYPAKYVLYRAIHYIYCFTPNAERYYPLKKMIARYGMEDTWQIYEEEETRFLDEVRLREQYRQFYRWTQTNPKRMLENAVRLESEEEIVANYKISHKMKQIWKVELDILDEVDRICRKYGLNYFLVHGSLLGAVRHKGFIPWDDDLDIAMPRKDYERFIELAGQELKEPLSIHTPRTEKDLFWGGFARIRNGQTTGIQSRELGHEGNLGIWVDLLPLDVCPEDEKKFRRKERRVRHYYGLLLAKIYGQDGDIYGEISSMQWRLYKLLSKCSSHDRLCRRLVRAQRMYEDEKSDQVAFFSGYEKYRRLQATDFEKTVLLEFEHRKVPAPVGYEHYLFALMGRDYMKYPPAEERKPKHRGIFDPDKPYGEYVKLLSGIFADIKGKQIILFGAGMMFEDYMKKYGDRYRPAFLADNDESKWGRKRLGLEIKPPKSILEVPAEKRRLIICSYYYKEIEKQLKEMGITDYRIYVQHAEWIAEAEEK